MLLSPRPLGLFFVDVEYDTVLHSDDDNEWRKEYVCMYVWVYMYVHERETQYVRVGGTDRRTGRKGVCTTERVGPETHTYIHTYTYIQSILTVIIIGIGFRVFLHLLLSLCDVDVQYLVFFTRHRVARALELHLLTQSIHISTYIHTYIHTYISCMNIKIKCTG